MQSCYIHVVGRRAEHQGLKFSSIPILQAMVPKVNKSDPNLLVAHHTREQVQNYVK